MKPLVRVQKHRKPVVRVLMLVLCVIAALSRFASAEQTPWMHIPENSFDQGWGLLDLDRLWDAGQWQEQRALTGSWGGTREQLYQAGIAVLGSYEGEFATNPVGGEVHKARYCDTLGVALFLDLERLFNFKDTFFLASAAQRLGHSLSADIPNFFTTQQLYGGETIRLVHLAVEKGFLQNRLDIVAGRINALDDFATSSYFCYSQNIGICGNPFSLQTNSSLSNYPLASWGLRGRYDVTPDLYSMTGVYNTYEHFGDNKYHGVDLSIRHNSGVAVIEEIAYRPKKRREAGYPGFLKIGGFYDSEPRPAFADDRLRTNPTISNNWTIYAIAQQKLYHLAGAELRQGLTGFLTLTYSPPASNTIQYFANAGLVYVGLVPHRENDAIGAFGLVGEFSNDLRASQREAHVDAVQTQEAVLELNYRYEVTAFSYVQPDIQYVIRPDGTGTVSNALVLGIQVGFTL
jgi:porin